MLLPAWEAGLGDWSIHDQQHQFRQVTLWANQIAINKLVQNLRQLTFDVEWLELEGDLAVLLVQVAISFQLDTDIFRQVYRFDFGVF